MKKEELSKLVFQRVILSRKNGFHYTGSIQTVSDDTLTFRDRYGNLLLISLEEIASVETLNGVKDGSND